MWDEFDVGLGPSWQYFDHVVVEGLSPARFLLAHQSNRQRAKTTLGRHALVALRLLNAEVENHLTFTPRPRFCECHFAEHASQLGLPARLDGEYAEEAIRLLAQRVTHETFESDESGTVHRLSHPDLPVSFLSEDLNLDTYAYDFAARIYRTSIHGVVGATALSRHFGVPLVGEHASVVGSQQHTNTTPSIEDTMLALDLPVLRGANSTDLLHFRQDHSDEFTAFRTSLRDAVRERAEARDNGDDPAAAARRISEQVIEPAIAELNRRLSTSRRALSSKLRFAISIAITSAAVGLVQEQPPLLLTPAALGVLGTSEYSKYRERYRDEIELHSMFFLWKAGRQLRKH